MKLTNKTLRNMIKEEIKEQKKKGNLNESLDPAMIAALQQIMTLDPHMQKVYANLINMVLGIPGAVGRGAVRTGQTVAKAAGFKDEPEESRGGGPSQEEIDKLVALISSLPDK